jgi:hypothetical protein
MAGPRAEDISRAISDLDLNATRSSNSTTPEKAEKGLHYTKDDLLDIGRSTHDKHAEHATIAELGQNGAPSPSGVKTPPYFDCPAPPPPTPATPQNDNPQTTNGTNGEVNGVANGVGATGENGAVAAEAKTKKRKSSGINKKLKVNPTGFEGLWSCG